MCRMVCWCLQWEVSDEEQDWLRGRCARCGGLQGVALIQRDVCEVRDGEREHGVRDAGGRREIAGPARLSRPTAVSAISFTFACR